MRLILIASPMIAFAFVAAAQMPSVPKLPTEGAPSIAAPSVTPPSGTSIPGTEPASNPIDQAKIEAECKIPTNAIKPECIELNLKK